MNNELLLLIEKHTDTLTEQTKSRQQEAPEMTMNQQMETLSFNPPIDLYEEGKRLKAATIFEATLSLI